MLDDAPESSAFTRYLLGLYWPLRSRMEWGKPLGVEAILQYLDMRGVEPAGLFDWICLADSEALAWMGEEQKREQESMKRRSLQTSRPPPRVGRA